MAEKLSITDAARKRKMSIQDSPDGEGPSPKTAKTLQDTEKKSSPDLILPDNAARRGRSPSEEGEERDDNPPLPDEEPPPLPDEEPPTEHQWNDGWEHRWDYTFGAVYFFNRFTGKSQWDNPRMPKAGGSSVKAGTPIASAAPGTEGATESSTTGPPPNYLGYNPKIHGDFDPNADYAKYHQETVDESETNAEATSAGVAGHVYQQSATFNRFTGKFQSQDKGPDKHNDANKSRRQMDAFFDVDRAANAHGGQSLKAQRQQQKLSKRQIQEYNDKKKAKKIKKDREWLTS